MKEIEINAATDRHEEFRRFSMSGAVAHHLVDMKPMDHVIVTSVTDRRGRSEGIWQVRSALQSIQAKTGMFFSTIALPNDTFMIWRIA